MYGEKEYQLRALIEDSTKTVEDLNKLLADPELDPAHNDNQALHLAVSVNPPLAWRLLAEPRVRQALPTSSDDLSWQVTFFIAGMSPNYGLISTIKRLVWPDVAPMKCPAILAENQYLAHRLAAYEAGQLWREKAVASASKNLEIKTKLIIFSHKQKLDPLCINRICSYLDFRVQPRR